MTIKYALFENHLSGAPDTYRALVQAKDTATLEDVIERIIDRGSTVTRADIVSVLEDYHGTIANLLLEGMYVNTPIANFKVSVGGIFDLPSDTFDPGRHKLRAAVSPGKYLKGQIAGRGRAVKGEATSPKPNLVAYTDRHTGEINGSVTAGGIGQVTGYRLKFDPADTAQGVFFVNSQGDATRASAIGLNNPGTLIFLVPAGLAPGEVQLEVRAAFGQEDVRTGTLKQTLTVL